MKKVLYFSLSLFYIASACNNSGSNSESASTDTSAGTDTSTADAGMGMDTSMNSNMPFMGAMNKMMQEMHKMTMTGDPDHDFAMMMKQHHQGAIDMSNIEMSKGANNEVKQVAQKIIDESKKDINDLDSFMNNHQPANSNSEFAKNAMDKMMSGSSQNMDHSGDIDQQFATMMSMHHQQGIEMSKDYLKSAKESAIKKVANRIIKTNSEDLKKLSKWQSTSTSGTSGSGMNNQDTASSGH